MVSDPKRGPVLEGAIARILAYKEDISLVMLAAAMPNPDQVASWVKASTVSTSWRPVPLDTRVYPVRTITEPWLQERMGKILREGGNILVFTMTRREAVEVATQLVHVVEKHSPLKAWELEEIEKHIRKILEESKTGLTEYLCKLMRHGVAFHHAGLPREAREAVEDLFGKRIIKAIASTTTLAYGMNLPARMVLIYGIRRFNPETGEKEYIPKSEVLNMAGRAGRPGLDPYGIVYILARNIREYTVAQTQYRSFEPEPVVSNLKTDYLLEHQVLATLSSNPGQDFLEKWFKNTYAYSLGILKWSNIIEAYKYLEENGLAKDYEPTDFGKLVAKLYIYPRTALFLQSYVLKNNLTVKEILRIASSTIEVKGLNHREEEAIQMWIHGVPEKVILNTTGVEPGRLYYLVENLEWITYSFYRIAEYHGKTDLSSTARVLSLRLRYGVPAKAAWEARRYEREKKVPKTKIRRFILRTVKSRR